MSLLNCPCGRRISRREKKLNDGLCNRCFGKGARKMAAEQGKKLR